MDENNIAAYEEQDFNIRHAQEVWQDFENGIGFQNSLKLRDKIPECQRFYEGDQWAKPTELTKHLPRPVFNYTALVVDNKVANVNGTQTKIIYQGENDEDTTKFTRFANWQTKEMQLNRIDTTSLKCGAIKGTYIQHFYWDEKARGRKGNYTGALRCEQIDPLNFFVANPREQDEQKQEWIIIKLREQVSSLKAQADKGVNKELIVADDDSENAYNEVEQETFVDNKKLATSLLRYFKKNGEVYFEKVVKQTIIYKPRCINPQANIQLAKQRISNTIDSQQSNSPDEDLNNKPYKALAYLYPICVGSWKTRDACIYGRGDVETIIPNQKIINFDIAMQILNHQELGMGKILVKANALNGQEIDNSPGQVITDYSTGNGWGITRLDGSQMTAASSSLIESLVAMTRETTSSSEVLTGDLANSGDSGYSIQLRQAQAMKPIAELQKNYHEFQERRGLVLQQFYKLYYEDAEYTYELEPYEMIEMEENNIRNGIKQPINVKQKGIFNGKDYQDKDFAVIVEVGADVQYSEITSMEFVQKLYMNGAIQKMSVEQFEQMIEMLNDKIFPYKSKLRALVYKQKQSELGRLKTTVEQQTQQLEQQTVYIKNQEVVIKQLQKELSQAQALLNQANNEYSQKIRKQNQFIGELFYSQNEKNKQNQEKPNKDN